MVKIYFNTSCIDETIDTIFRFIHDNIDYKILHLKSYNCEELNNIRCRRNIRYGGEDKKDKFVYYPDFGKYEICYKDNLLIFNYEKKSDILVIGERLGFYKEFNIECNVCEKDDDNKTIIENFIDDLTNKKIDKFKKYIKIYISSNEGYWEYLNKISKRTPDTIYLKDKKDILDDVELFFKSEDEYKEHGIPYKRNYLLHGPPGTGKSSIVKCIASIYNLDIYILTLSKKVDDNEFTRLITRLKYNSILLLEDIDALFIEREKSSNNNFLSFSCLLNTLDGVTMKDKQIIFMTTNHIEKLDEAFKRPGRIDKIIKFNYSDKNQIKEMICGFLKNIDETMQKQLFKKICNIKTTSAILQKFLFENRNEKNILDKLDDYTSLTDQYNKTLGLYS